MTCCGCFSGLGGNARSKPSPHVGVIGELFIDIQSKVSALPQWNTDIETNAVEVFPGGCAANTARQLATMVRSVTLFSTHGDDLLGRAALDQMRSQGFDTSHIRKVPVPSSVCVVLSGPADRAMVSCYSSIEQMRVALVDVDTLLSCG